MSKNKDAQAPEAIVEYLTRQNRPYSAIDICNNLHKEYGKTAIVKGCEMLTEQKRIKEKTYGKQKVYVVDQSQFGAVAESEISTMGKHISQLTDDVNGYQADVRLMEAELKTLNLALTTEEAEKRLTSVDDERLLYKKRLDKLKNGNNSVTPQQKDEIHSCKEKYLKEWRKRKRLANDIFGAILEGYPNTKKQLFEEIGVETDEDYKVKLPD